MMAMCSKKAYLKPQSVQARKNDVDTNVVQIKFDIMKENVVKIHQGDPTVCKKCQIVLNKYSVVEKNVQNDQFQQGHEQIWICEFCNEKNVIQIETEELPTTEDVVYLIQSVQEAQQEKQNLQIDNSIVFCIDNSGSMSTSTEIKGKIQFKHGISQEEYDMLKQFIEPGDEAQIMPGKNKNVTYVSRKQCVLAAIEQQIAELKKSNPNKIVGLVTFNNEVVLFGDGTQQPITITGDKLFKQDEINQESQGAAQQLMSQPISKSAELLLQKFEKLQEKGQTALGPALIASLQLAKYGKPGSMVIICTDGLANLGLGSLEGLNEQGQFYEDLSKFAAENGIIVSIVTIKGEGCKIDLLCKLSELTNGTVTRVKPEEISNDFATILKDELVGTQVELIVKLHRALKFRNEDDLTLTTTLQKNVGNATVATTHTFEYQLKEEEELKVEQIDVNLIKKVPFQIKINYTNLHGDRLMRVVTNIVDTTQDLKAAEQEAQVEIIHKRMAQKTANIARQGKYQDAQKYNNDWDQYVQKNEAINSNEVNQCQNMEFQAKNTKLSAAIEKQAYRKTPIIIPEPKKQEGFLDKLGSLFGGNSPPKAPQQQQQKQQQQQQQQKVQQQEQKQKQQLFMEEEDEDQEAADLFNYEQAKY